MAIVQRTFHYFFTSSAPVSLSTLTGWVPHTWIMAIAMRAARDNASDVYWRDENGESGGFIGPAEAATFDFTSQGALIRNFNLQGASGDSVFITIGLNSHHYDYDGT